MWAIVWSELRQRRWSLLWWTIGVAGIAMPIANSLDNAAAQHQHHTVTPQPGQAPNVNVVPRRITVPLAGNVPLSHIAVLGEWPFSPVLWKPERTVTYFR